MRTWKVVSLEHQFPTGPAKEPNLVDVYFHFKHGIVDDVTQLCDEEDINYFQQLVTTTENFGSARIRSNDGIDIALFKSGQEFEDTYHKPYSELDFEGRIHGYYPTVATLWKYFATGIVDAPIRYGEGTKAFNNLRTMLATGQEFLLCESYRDDYEVNDTRYMWSITPRRLSIIESETLYKIKDLRYWLNYIGLVRFEELSEPLTQMTDEILTQLLPYIYRFVKEENTVLKGAKKITRSRTSRSRNDTFLSFDGKLFASEKGELIVQDSIIAPRFIKDIHSVSLPVRRYKETTSPIVQSLMLKTLEQMQPTTETRVSFFENNWLYRQFFETFTTHQAGTHFPDVVDGATDWERKPTTTLPLQDFALRKLTKAFKTISIQKIEDDDCVFFAVLCQPEEIDDNFYLTFIDAPALEEEEITQHLVSIILNQLLATNSYGYNFIRLQTAFDRIGWRQVQEGKSSDPIELIIRSK